ncbi:putative outer membrane protein A [hydrothermal vent metagenome]|uniref:Putative outer membrane protein A n=1 Tax=hydrothermal vent metagenome TaxID=652676 RepID=A0A1W1CF28_9ZZZZ
MKKVKQSVVAILLSSVYSFAGGDVAPIQEPVIDVPVVVEPELTGFYAGVGYSCLQMGLDVPYLDMRSMTAGSVTAGYNFNEYIAVEGRYTASIGDVTVKTVNSEVDTDAIDLANIGLYVKPQYSINNFGIYALLGYGQFSLDDDGSFSEAGFQYGAGINAMVSTNVSLFIDYRRLYDDTAFDDYDLDREVMANSYTVGVNYHF